MVFRRKNEQPRLPRHVVVVEDDAVLGMDIEDMLRRHGVEMVEVCATAQCALATLRKAQPDVVILDVHLADSDDGWAIAELLDTASPRPPRIIFSTGAPQDIPSEIAKLGELLEKPYDPARLLTMLTAPERPGLLARLRRD